MGSVGTPELIVIFVVALIVLGPERLPGIARQMGKAMGEFRRMSSGFQDEIRKAIDDPAEYTPSFPSRTKAPSDDPANPASPDDTATAPTPSPAPSVRAVTPTDTTELPPPPDDPSRN